MARSRSPEERHSDAETGRHRALLENPKVRSWYDARCLRSRLSADRYLRQLGLILERLGVDANSVVGLAKEDPDGLRDRLVRYAGEQKRAGRLDTYLLKTFDGLRSYLEHRRVRFGDFPKLSPIRGVSLRSERVPTPEELGRVLERLSLRGRVIALLMAHSGLRPGVIGYYGGENGLRLGDLTDLRLGASPSFREVPFAVHVPAELSKTRIEYVTFGTRQLATAVLAYLDSRRERGEKLTARSPVVGPGEMRGAAQASRRAARFGRGFLTTKAVVEELRDALRASVPSGVTWRPYVLRGYCSTRLLLAEGDGRISRDLREAILGHDGGVASRYNVGKRWGAELLDEARREYARASSFLETGRSRDEPDLLQQTKLLLLEAVGYTPKEAAQRASRPKEEVIAEVRKRLGASAAPETAGQLGEPVVRQPVDRLVRKENLSALLAEGWAFVSPVGADQAVVRWPHGDPVRGPLPAEAPGGGAPAV